MRGARLSPGPHSSTTLRTGVVSAETFAAAAAPVPAAELRAFMSSLDVFSPNAGEAASMLWGPTPGAPAPAAAEREPRRLTEPFLEAGAGLVLLRCGAAGVVVQDAASGEAWRLPAFPDTAVVDPTGAGNACCGAALAALTQGVGVVAAAAWGCAAGSMMAEHTAFPSATPRELAGEAARRQAAVLALAERL